MVERAMVTKTPERIQRSLFDGPPAPPPPTGPAADIPEREANKYNRYLEWRQTVEGKRAWVYMVQECRKLLDEARLVGQELRISTKWLAEQVRRIYKIHVNNSYTGWLADDLVEFNPSLLDVIERRKRRKPKDV